MIKHSGPEDICECGHVKNFHVFINDNPQEGESIVGVGDCYKCDCAMYNAAVVSEDNPNA